MGKKTEPKYATRLAHKAISRFEDNDKKLYPAFTTKTDENSRTNHVFLCRTRNTQPIKSSTEMAVTELYIMGNPVDLSPTPLQPESPTAANSRVIMPNKRFFIKLSSNRCVLDLNGRPTLFPTLLKKHFSKPTLFAS
jgi:hypothetical protein